MKRKPRSRKEGTLTIDAKGAEEAMAGAEPWEPVETHLVVWSFVAAAAFLVVFGFFINNTILSR